MRTTVASGLPVSFCVSVCVLIALLSVPERADAKRGCSAFGHSCFGGHGKRFDPHVQHAIRNNDPMNDQGEEFEPVKLDNQLFLNEPEQRYQTQEEKPFAEEDRQDQKIDPYTLSLFVGQWLASHRRIQHPEFEMTDN